MTTAWQIFSSFSKLGTTNRRRRKLRAYEAARSCAQTKNAQWPGQRLCETAFDFITDSSYILKYFSPIVLDKVALHIYKLISVQPTCWFQHLHSCQLGHGVSNLLGPKKKGFWSKINKLVSFVNWHIARASKSAKIVLSKSFFYVKK